MRVLPFTPGLSDEARAHNIRDALLPLAPLLGGGHAAITHLRVTRLRCANYAWQGTWMAANGSQAVQDAVSAALAQYIPFDDTLLPQVQALTLRFAGPPPPTGAPERLELARLVGAAVLAEASSVWRALRGHGLLRQGALAEYPQHVLMPAAQLLLMVNQLHKPECQAAMEAMLAEGERNNVLEPNVVQTARQMFALAHLRASRSV